MRLLVSVCALFSVARCDAPLLPTPSTEKSIAPAPWSRFQEDVRSRLSAKPTLKHAFQRQPAKAKDPRPLARLRLDAAQTVLTELRATWSLIKEEPAYANRTLREYRRAVKNTHPALLQQLRADQIWAQSQAEKTLSGELPKAKERLTLLEPALAVGDARLKEAEQQAGLAFNKAEEAESAAKAELEAALDKRTKADREEERTRGQLQKQKLALKEASARPKPPQKELKELAIQIKNLETSLSTQEAASREAKDLANQKKMKLEEFKSATAKAKQAQQQAEDASKKDGSPTVQLKKLKEDVEALETLAADLKGFDEQVAALWDEWGAHGEDIDSPVIDMVVGSRFSTLNTGGGFFGGSVFYADLQGVLRSSKPYKTGWWELKGGAQLISLKMEKPQAGKAIEGARTLAVPMTFRGFWQWTPATAGFLGTGVTYVDPRGGRSELEGTRTEPFTQKWVGMGLRFTKGTLRDSSVQFARLQDPAFVDPRRLVFTGELRIHTTTDFKAPRAGVEAVVAKLQTNKGFSGPDETTLVLGLSLNPSKIFSAMGDLANTALGN